LGPNSFGSKEVNEAPKRFRDCVWLLAAQSLGAFNDNATKAMLPALAALVIGKGQMDLVNQQVSLMLILPFVLFGPLAGWLSDRFSKRKVTSVALFAQVVGLAILCLGMGMQLFYLSLAGFFLLAVQSAMLSPAKKGILKELVGSEKLGMAVGWMEMLTMVGILAGAYAGAKGFDALVKTEGGWRAGLLVSAAVGVLAVFSWIIFRPTPEVSPRSKKTFQAAILVSHFKDLAYLWKEKPLRLAALGDAWFWAFGSFFYLVLVKLAGEVVEGDVGMASLYGFWFLLLGVGIMAGSLIVAYLNRGRVDLGLVPLGAVIMAVALYLLTRVDPESTPFELCCVALGAGGAFFFVPLNAFLQDRAGEERRGRVVAASNLLTNLLVIALIGVHAYLSNSLQLTAMEELLIMVIPSALLAAYVAIKLPEAFFRTFATVVTRILYRVKITGGRRFPKEGGVLILCNHLSFADPVLLGSNAPREVQFLAFSGLAESRFMKLVFRFTSTIPVSPTRAKDAISSASNRLKAGSVICIFPEGSISRAGPLQDFKKGFELIARKADVPVVPACLDGVWGSMFSFSKGRFFRKWPRSFPYPVRLRFGEPIPANEAKSDRVRKEIRRLLREAFSERPEMQVSLSQALQVSLKRRAKEPFLFHKAQANWTRAEMLRLATEKPQQRDDAAREKQTSEEEILQLLTSALDGATVKADGVTWPAPELLASVIRLSETHLWNVPAFRVRLEGSIDSPWDQTWRLWAPVLGGLAVREEEDGLLTLGRPHAIDSCVDEPFSGLAVPGLGVVAINLPDPPPSSDGDQQIGATDGSLGLVLSGLEIRIMKVGGQEEAPDGESGELEFAGVAGEWVAANRRGRLDQQGFLFPADN